MKMKRSNLIPITRIYDIYPKYTYSEDVKKFMDEIVDIDRANVFTKADMVNILNEIRADIEQLRLHKAQFLTNNNKVCIDSQEVLDVIDKYKAESEN